MSHDVNEPAGLDLVDPETVRADVETDYLVDAGSLGPGLGEMITALDADPGRKIAITRDGQVVAVMIDPTDAKIFEGLELEAESEWSRRVDEEEPGDDTWYTLEGEPIDKASE